MGLQFRYITLVLVALLACFNGFAQSAGHASQAINASGQASGYAGASAAHGIVASGQATSAAIAVPLSVGAGVLGSAAMVSAGAGSMAMQAATTPIGQPLPVSERVITTLPPNQALKKERGNP